MRGVVKTGRGPGLVELRNVPEPTPGPGEVLIQVAAAAICGSDLHIRRNEHPYGPPVVLGCEFSGTVRAVGEGVTGYAPGDRVVSETSTGSCSLCFLCRSSNRHICAEKRAPGIGRDGAFADLVVMPAALLHRVPDNLPAGPIILSGTASDAALRLRAAHDLGADVTVNGAEEDLAERVMALTAGRGADVVFDTSGAAGAIAGLPHLARRLGCLCAVGVVGRPEVSFPWDVAVFKGLEVQFSFSSRHTSWVAGLRLLASGKVRAKPLLTMEVPLERWQEAFEAQEEGRAIKALLVRRG